MSPSVDVEVVFDRCISRDGTLDALQEVLLELAPKWCAGLKLYESARDQQAIDLSKRYALARATVAGGLVRGELYHRLTGDRDKVLHESGAVELRGAGPAITVVIRFNERPLARIGGRLLFGNTFTAQLRRATVEARPAHEWASRLLERLAARLSPAWGAVFSREEYDRKVMSDGPSIWAEGRDFASFIPGLMTVNYFGEPYVELLGKERLITAPVVSATAVGDGVLLCVGLDPRRSSEAQRLTLDERVLEHLGREYFFSKGRAPVGYAAPEWDKRSR